jgi:dihydrofolate reductase
VRDVILFIATSLDGYLAGPSGEIDWLFTDQDYGYTEFWAGIDTVLMGRKTYEVSLSFGEYPYRGRQGFVWSRTRSGHDENVTFLSFDVGRAISPLKHEPGKHIWLVGGSELVAECVRRDVIDRYAIFVHPTLLGNGIPLFRTPLPGRSLRLTGVERFSSGLGRLSYGRPG